MPAPGNAVGNKAGRSENHPRRLVLDAIFYLVRGGIAWRGLPTGFRSRRGSTTSSATGLPVHTDGREAVGGSRLVIRSGLRILPRGRP
ncbi:transposase [Nocardia sp. CA-135953]|uniref:transposase n=1 Tax=Nocardia sp. CA-135953 TaxID=3239978 RepID=UPI003D9845EA